MPEKGHFEDYYLDSLAKQQHHGHFFLLIILLSCMRGAGCRGGLESTWEQVVICKSHTS